MVERLNKAVLYEFADFARHFFRTWNLFDWSQMEYKGQIPKVAFIATMLQTKTNYAQMKPFFKLSLSLEHQFRIKHE